MSPPPAIHSLLRSIAACVLALAGLAAGCGGRAREVVTLYEAGDYAGAARTADRELAAHPDDEGLWQMRVRTALAQGDAPGVGKAYAAYRDRLGDDDRPLLVELATATLGQALASPSEKVKVAAIQAVAAAELLALADRVAERMTDDDDRVVAAAAVAVLRGYPDAPRFVGEMLRSEDPEARRIAVDGIGQKVGKLALDDLRTAAGDADAQVRRTAIRWLGQLADAGATERLVAALRDPDDGVRAAAASALARLGTAVDLVAFGHQALGDSTLGVRLAGVELLAAARTPVARSALLALADDPDAFIATEAAIAAGDPALAARALDRAVAAQASAVRAGAANIAVRAVGKPAAAAVARKLIGDPEASVRLAAARLLASTGDRAAALEVFAAALTSAEQLQAAVDLAQHDDPRGLAALDAAVRDPQHGPAGRAGAADGHRTARRITPGLVAALADDSGAVRVQAAAAIAVLARRDRD